MTYEEYEKNTQKMEFINKLLDKLNNMLNKVNEEEKQQILIYMEYLEIEYRKLENGFVKIKKSQFQK